MFLLEFPTGIKRTLETFPVDTMNRTIDSVPGKVKMASNEIKWYANKVLIMYSSTKFDVLNMLLY